MDSGNIEAPSSSTAQQKRKTLAQKQVRQQQQQQRQGNSAPDMLAEKAADRKLSRYL
jgi:hypothetical protein